MYLNQEIIAKSNNPSDMSVDNKKPTNNSRLDKSKIDKSNEIKG